mgnify:CR=1 FL=1
MKKTMTNPFETMYDKSCDNCGDSIMSGDLCYGTGEDFLCEDCASTQNLICNCGNYKKSEYDECFNCHQEKQNNEFDF